MKGNILITVLVFVSLGLIVAVSAVSVGVVNTYGVSSVEFADESLSLANFGVEYASLKILRNSTYAGETISFTNGSVVIVVSGTMPDRTITSTAMVSDFVREVTASGTFSSNKLTIY